MQSFPGMANYLGKFTQRLASLSTLFRQLMKGNAYTLMPHLQLAVQVIIDDICKETILRYYKPDLDLVLECNAFKIAMGMSLLQDFMQDPLNIGTENFNITMLEPLAFSSKTLTLTEQHYANIKREMLAFIYSLEKFQYCMLGRHSLVLSDHKPLVLNMRKDIDNAPLKLQ